MLEISRRTLIGGALLGTGAVLSACGLKKAAQRVEARGKVLISPHAALPDGIYQAARFPLIEAIQGRRSRRFARGAAIPDGPLAFTSRHDPRPLTQMEQMLLLTTVSGNTGWANLIPYNRHYLPSIPNYAASAGGRSFPSAAGFHTTEVFYTDDEGVYFFPTRDLGELKTRAANGEIELEAYLAEHGDRVVKLSSGRMNLPPQHMEGHNDWCVNVPGSTLLFPVSDLAQHHLLNLCYIVQNGACMFDDVTGGAIPGMERFSEIVDIDNPWPMTLVEQMSLTEVTVESSTSCYAGMLMLQALGLGGWMFGGINPTSVLGASGDPAVPGLGFRFDTDERWPLPNATGLEGHFEGFCPPHYPDMRSAVDAVIERKFGKGGPYNAQTPGPYRDNAAVRGAGARHDELFRDCVATMAEYTFSQFGKFPATVPSIFTMMYLQAHVLDTEFYDRHLNQGGYLHTHVDHDRNWPLPR